MGINITIDINCILITIAIIISVFVARSCFMKYCKLKQIDQDINKTKLYMDIDPKAAEKEIDDLVSNYVKEYAFEKFIINRVDFIKKSDIEKMVSNVFKKIVIEISDVYIFYIKTIVNIKDEEDLAIYIRKKTKEHVLGYVTQYNKPSEK